MNNSCFSFTLRLFVSASHYIPDRLGQEVEWDPSTSNCFFRFVNIGARFCFCPSILMSSTYTDQKSPRSRCRCRHSQPNTFSHPSNRICSRCRSHSSPANGWQYTFLSDRTTGSSFLFQLFGHLERCNRIHTTGHFFSGNLISCGASSTFSRVRAVTASPARPVHPGSLEIMFHIFAADICDADCPCCVNPVKLSASSFALSSLSTTRPEYVWNIFIQFITFEVT